MEETNMKNRNAQIFTELLGLANIQVNGTNPWDIQVHNHQLFNRVLQEPSLALGETYMAGWWDCNALDDFFYRILRAELDQKIKNNFYTMMRILIAKFINLQTKQKALIVGQKHYDLGNDLFQRMLDKNMNYTCAYWKNATNLEDAQTAKLALVCEKLKLQPGMKLLDIGCGWGALAKYAAENYGVKVIGITISEQQAAFAQQTCKGLPIDIRFQDYRDLTESFDRVVSLGMFEHVGHLNYRTYMQKVHACLPDDGLFLLHTIGSNETLFNIDAWTRKYIFPNGMLPSIAQIGNAIEKLFMMEDWHNFGADYDPTLMAWQQNFIQHWDEIKSNYNECFYRMWNYYLLSCAGGFRARGMQLWQIVLSKKGIVGGYRAPR